jgi:hypothetical protein
MHWLELPVWIGITAPYENPWYVSGSGSEQPGIRLFAVPAGWEGAWVGGTGVPAEAGATASPLPEPANAIKRSSGSTARRSAGFIDGTVAEQPRAWQRRQATFLRTIH